MSYPVAHVSSLVNVGGKIGRVMTGAPAHLVGGGGGGGSSGVSHLVEIFESIGMETEDMSPTQRRAYIDGKYGEGATDALDAANPPLVDNGETDSNAPPPVSSGNVSCDGITNSTPDSFKVSPNYTVLDLRKTYQFNHPIPARVATGLSRAQVICNLRYLCQNSVEPLRAWMATNMPNYTFRIGSGFRNNNDKSDHSRGQAVDLHFFSKNGGRVNRQTCLAISKRIKDEARIPFTQMLLEYDGGNSMGWLHIANRRSGNSALRIGYTLNASQKGSIRGGFPTSVR